MKLKAISSYLSGLLGGLLALRLIHACSPQYGYRKPTTTQRILQAPRVLYGKVIRTFPDPNYEHAKGSVYTALMEIYCSLKGPRVHRMLNISEAGQMPGHCSSAILVAGRIYFVLLNHDLKPQGDDYSEIEVNAETVHDVSIACGLTPLYPHGVDASTTSVHCTEVALSDNCFSESMMASSLVHDNDTSAYPGMNYGGGAAQNSVSFQQTLILLTTNALILSSSLLFSMKL